MESPLRKLQSRISEARMILLEVQQELKDYPEPDWGLIRWIANAKIYLARTIQTLEDIEVCLAGTAYFEEKEMEIHGSNVNTRND